MFMSTWNGNNLSEKSFHGFVSHPPWMCASCTFPWPQEWQLGSIMPLLLLLFTRLVVSSFATPGALACQSPLSIGFPRQEYWSGWPFPSPGDLPHPGIKPVSPALEGKFFTTVPRGKPFNFLPLSKFSLSANSHQPYSRHRPTHTHTSLNHQQKCPGSNQIMISHLVLSSWPQRLCFQMQTFRLPKSFASKPGSLTKTREISQRFHPPAFSVAETVDRRQPSLSWCAIIPFFYFTVQNKQRQS